VDVLRDQVEFYRARAGEYDRMLDLSQPAELAWMLRDLGWDATVTPLGRYHVGVARQAA
jgi:hypothetical protein